MTRPKRMDARRARSAGDKTLIGGTLRFHKTHSAVDVNPRHGRIVNVKREMSSTFCNHESQFGAVLGAGPCNRVYSTVKRES
jgi:hypothetical protein